jgi:dihydropteroate synthase
VLPVIEGLAGRVGESSISIDTMKRAVAERALDAGASFVNDVSAFRADPEMAGLVASRGVDCCLMHMLGEPRTMQHGVGGNTYRDVVDEVKAFLAERLEFALAEGIAEERVLLDPGIGFGKTAAHNLELLRRLDELTTLGRPLVIGTSRKSFLGRITPGEPSADERLPGTLATNVLAYERGAEVFRVHDVAAVRDALAVTAATLGARWTPRTAQTTARS